MDVAGQRLRLNNFATFPALPNGLHDQADQCIRSRIREKNPIKAQLMRAKKCNWAG